MIISTIFAIFFEKAFTTARNTTISDLLMIYLNVCLHFVRIITTRIANIAEMRFDNEILLIGIKKNPKRPKSNPVVPE